MLKLLIYLMFFPIIAFIWLLKLVFWVPLILIGIIFGDLPGTSPDFWP